MPIPVGDWANISPTSTVPPVTLASAATIVPTTYLTILTGNVAVVNITPPVTFGHTLAVQFAGTAGVTAAGNIATAKASVVGEIIIFVFNSITQKYIPVG